VLASQGNDYQALMNRGKAFLLFWDRLSLNQGGVLDNATTDFESASKLQPNDPQALFYLGLTQSLKKDPNYRVAYQNAIAVYLDEKTSVELLDIDFPILVHLAASLVKIDRLDQENFEKADRLLKKAQDIKPQSNSLVYNRGSLNAIAGNYRSAIQLFNQVIKDNAKNTSALRSKGFAFLLLGSSYSPDALNAFGMVSQYAPTSLRLASKYIPSLENCLQTAENQQAEQTTNQPRTLLKNSNCSFKLTRDRLQPAVRSIFPNLPVYKCKEYPILAIAQEKSQSRLCD